ncbi:N-acetylmuramoyl-L-alanine amidase [Bhargavaea beijingensis]|uniref:N-acetylmuramoyl-L-alanine amidase n=1 Tax=Bhargavaea beijingensis TaxID=426756 RepID=A0A1G7CL93_9BACL|nr:N-acetylmuramoyl-L-alanine amidase [Bhargavaea beijingensis]MCW1927031.1 N-acetylmuramoyl-L-alanine amidase [Bhargavaea beijingensis]RSK30762.1 N-acetylmuramoyl-L-alanine amidase [Bhargavaea beijingensis]SDE40097.1 N-acetylmuramoyl-L-alanine amidase [Bhargavaea beijingensis]
MRNKRKIALSILLVCGLLLGFNGTSGSVRAAGTVTVDTDSINVRSGPGLAHSVTGSLKRGDTVKILGSEGDWLYVDTGSSKGYIAAYLTKSSAAPASGSDSIISQVDRLNVRAQPTTSSAVLLKMNRGDQATSHGSSGGWTEVTVNGTRGWVSSQYITASSASPDAKGAKAESGTFTVAVSALNVREKPDLTAAKVTVVRQGESYPVTESHGNWVKLSIGGKEGWVYSFHGVRSSGGAAAGNSVGKTGSESDKPSESVTILYDGTNLRSSASTSSDVVKRASAGENFSGVREGDWFRISLNDGSEAYVASWVVSIGEAAELKDQKKKADRKAGTLNGITLVIDPGHGGNDGGTTGLRGTNEKDLTLPTAELLASKLRAAGAEVILTRETDEYVGLRKRVSLSNQAGADAFISLHYDATTDHSVRGFTTYYQKSIEHPFAEYVNIYLGKSVNLKDRGVQKGNYLVLRENRQPSILVELGFLSNLSEERRVTNPEYREQATDGIYRGIIKYFDSQLGR